MKSLKEFVNSCGGKYRFEFDDEFEASNFGKKLKEIAKEEEGAKTIFDLEEIEIKISNNYVRVKLLEHSLI